MTLALYTVCICDTCMHCVPKGYAPNLHASYNHFLPLTGTKTGHIHIHTHAYTLALLALALQVINSVPASGVEDVKAAIAAASAGKLTSYTVQIPVQEVVIESSRR